MKSKNRNKSKYIYRLTSSFLVLMILKYFFEKYHFSSYITDNWLLFSSYSKKNLIILNSAYIYIYIYIQNSTSNNIEHHSQLFVQTRYNE